jgi:hypothetical protein
LMKSLSNGGILDNVGEGVLYSGSCKYFMPNKSKIASGGFGIPACLSHIPYISKSLHNCIDGNVGLRAGG